MTDYEHYPAPETVTLPILNGDTITIRKRLTIGEERRARFRMYIYIPDTNTNRVDPTMGKMTTILAYLLDWTVRREGKKVEIRDLVLQADRDPSKVAELQRELDLLDPMTFDAIGDAILAHETAEDARRGVLKKTSTGAVNESLTASSPSTPAGPLSTSDSSSERTMTTS